MNLSIVPPVLLAVGTTILVGCTDVDEATTRKEQAQAFKNSFRFPPPAELVEISYQSESAWFPNLAGHLSLMRFTYIPSVFEKIQTNHGFGLEVTWPASVNKPPTWWHDPSPGAQIFRSATNGLVKLMWIEKTNSFVYYQEFNVD